MRVEWQGRQDVNGYLRQRERHLPENGALGVKDEAEQQKGAERRRVVMESEREMVEGMVVGNPGEQRSGRQKSRWGHGML